MNNQTADYISLKAIADRFKEVAASFTEDDIRRIIESEIRNQVKEQIHIGTYVQDVIEDYFFRDDTSEKICTMIEDNIKSKFQERRY